MIEKVDTTAAMSKAGSAQTKRIEL